MKLPSKMGLMHVTEGLGVQEHLVVNVRVIERKIDQLIDYLAEREAEESEAYAQGWNEGQLALQKEIDLIGSEDGLSKGYKEAMRDSRPDLFPPDRPINNERE